MADAEEHVILLVEDNEADAELTREALEESGSRVRLDWVTDGEKAMAYLRGEDAQAGGARPDLILLDLNMPRKDGREVLREVKEDARLAEIPVVILTTSTAEEDVLGSYRQHANAYLSKPITVDDLVRKLNGLVEFWFRGVANLPRRD